MRSSRPSPCATLGSPCPCQPLHQIRCEGHAARGAYWCRQDTRRRSARRQPGYGAESLALLLRYSQGRYADAEPLYKRSLAIREKTLGPDHEDVATSLNNLAELYRSQERYADAEPLLKRSLAIREAANPDDPAAAPAMANLAALYDNQGRYAEAEPLSKRALAVLDKALGPNDPDIAIVLNILADLYYNQDRYADAEQLHKRSLALTELAGSPALRGKDGMQLHPPSRPARAGGHW
jgi:tetratricopeptide (TPR) repeat protein